MNILPPPAERLAGSEPPTTEEIATYVVGAAVWASSVHNTQPWWFSASGQQISLLDGAGRQLMVADPGGRTQLDGGSYPQLVLRLGTVIRPVASVWRPPDSVLSAGACEHLGSSHG